MVEDGACRLSKTVGVGNTGKDKGPTVHRKRMKVTLRVKSPT